MSKLVLVCYEGDTEVIVTSFENEESVVKKYFTDGCRDIDAYDRVEGEDFAIQTSVRIG